MGSNSLKRSLSDYVIAAVDDERSTKSGIFTYTSTPKKHKSLAQYIDSDQIKSSDTYEFSNFQRKLDQMVRTCSGLLFEINDLIHETKSNHEQRNPALDSIKQYFLEGYEKLLRLSDESSHPSNQALDEVASKTMYDQLASGSRIMAEELVDMEEVGKGTFGMVFKSSWNACVVAKKVINKTRKNIVHSYGSAGPLDDIGVTPEDANNEVEALRKLRHPHIVLFMDAFQDDDKWSIITEFVPSNLEKYLNDLGSASPSLIWNISKQIASGCCYLHTMNIYHRDLKPSNILIDPITSQVKIADFGLAKLSSHTVKYVNMEGWLPSHALNSSFSNYEKGDVFSFGQIICWMFVRRKPLELTEQGTSLRTEFQYKTAGLSHADHFLDLTLGCTQEELELIPTFKHIVGYFEAHENPFELQQSQSFFFQCGKLTARVCVIECTAVWNEMGIFANLTKELFWFSPSDLEATVDWNLAVNKSENYPSFAEHYQHFLDEVQKKKITNNHIMALKFVDIVREGEEERQQLKLKFSSYEYIYHMSMQRVWKSLDDNTKWAKLNHVPILHPDFTTSFGVQVTVISSDGYLVFTQRSSNTATAKNGIICGITEGMSLHDVVDGVTPSPFLTAIRGLHEELGLDLEASDIHMVRLLNLYLKFDTSEVGMFGYIDFRSPDISEDRRFTFSQILESFKQGAKDKFETTKLIPIMFDLETVASFVKAHYEQLVPSAFVSVITLLNHWFRRKEVSNKFI